MYRSSSDSWLGGVIGGIAESTGISSTLLRIISIVLFFGIGGLTLGISSSTLVFIYILFWILTKKR